MIKELEDILKTRQELIRLSKSLTKILNEVNDKILSYDKYLIETEALDSEDKFWLLKDEVPSIYWGEIGNKKMLK